MGTDGSSELLQQFNNQSRSAAPRAAGIEGHFKHKAECWASSPSTGGESFASISKEAVKKQQ